MRSLERKAGRLDSDVNQYTGYSVRKYHPRAGYSSTVGTESAEL